MNTLWTYVILGLLTLVAAVVVAGGEPAAAELRVAEAATAAAAAGMSIACIFAAPAVLSTATRAAGID